ncbi:type I secretion system permease/ATPase [Azospirillum canadense]|uniref:type I secretion system permease/ATPase n=1 Tax=Azospirillum canadense TaxID=403962 RepID=UPI002227310F|nr:type I secretion system permease/ATPase [Azospirillum canadense]MCW2242389.1 PrtD family type I secretion system ABC transporter [Azospirillum canadense]
MSVPATATRTPGARTRNRPDTTPLRHALREVRRGLLVVAVFSLFLNMLVLVSPVYSTQVYDRVLSSGRVETLVALTAAAGLALVVMALLDILRSRALARIGFWLERALAGTLLEVSVREALAGQPSGTQAIRDLGQIRGFITGPGIAPIFDAPWAPVFIVLIWIVHPWLGILAFVAALLLSLLAVANEVATRAPLQEANQTSVIALRQSEAALRNAEVIEAMGMLPALLARWDAVNDRVLAWQTAASDRTGVILGITKALRILVQLAVLGLGADLVLRGELTGGGMVAASILLGRALAPVEQAIGAWKGFIGARAAHGRLEALLLKHPTHPAPVRLPTPEGQVTVDQLAYVPPGGGSRPPILRQISFDLAPGEVLGVVGPSACGKSTLCRLLVGIWAPTAGEVRLDGAQVRSWDRADFGRHVGYLPQDVELFAGTVAENIARLTPDASDAAVIEAAQTAGVHEMILRLPQGYATEIGISGIVLSGGQRQRIGLARALFGQPRLIVLDEPNANLDHAGEAALADAIERVKSRGATVILVAHRPSIMTHVDKLLVMQDGAVAMFGPRDRILPQLIAPRPAQRAAS